MVEVRKIVGSYQVILFFKIILVDCKLFAQNALTVEFDASNFNHEEILHDPVQWHRRTNEISKKNDMGKENLNLNILKHFRRTNNLKDGEVIEFSPGKPAFPFDIWDIDQKIIFPSKEWTNKSIVLHVFDPDSGFLECMWNSDEALAPLAKYVLNNTHFIFIPKRATLNETYGALWMKTRILSALKKSNAVLIRSGRSISAVMDQMHFSVEPVSKLGNSIPSVLQQWECVDHLCGLDQAVFQKEGQKFPIVLKRLDARYDWLSSPSRAFGNNSKPVVVAGNGCQMSSLVNQTVALVTSDGCSYFQKVSAMEKSGAVGVIVVAVKGQVVKDMNCIANECATPLSIPATFVEYSDIFQSPGRMNVTFQNTPTSNFFMAIDRAGNLAEVGWFLYPSTEFLIWQAQWFDYQESLSRALSMGEMVVEIFKDKVMQGNEGVVVNVTLPALQDLRLFSKMELDMSLSCPGTKDTTCGHWDHTVNLYVCCDSTSPLCGMELGRWITSFRRRIGRWLTDVSPLMPLFTSNTCTFTMKTAPWAMPWIPSLNLRFSQPRTLEDPYPARITPMFFPGATFDKNYNSHFKPISFSVSSNVSKVELFSVITGHGSDENGCGEFCVTSHHLTVNGVDNNITFSTAGSPLGCADLVLTGVEPNEHGTWLYGRNGWCDGRNVFPWVVDITQQVKPSGSNNTVQYFGHFNGTDPNPKQNPGIIYIYSYLVFYEKPLSGLQVGFG